MRKMKTTAALLAIMSIVGAGALAGCNDTKGAEASTPAGSETLANTAVQTDEQGNTSTTAAPAPGGATGADTATGAAPAPGGEEVKGDVAAGKAKFEATCQGCHPAGGTSAGVGPALAKNPNINPQHVRDMVTKGKGAMPPGLVTDPKEQDDLIAFLMSEQ